MGRNFRGIRQWRNMRNTPMTALRQFLARAIVIDYIIYRDLWDKYVLRVPKRKISRPRARDGSLQAWVNKNWM